MGRDFRLVQESTQGRIVDRVVVSPVVNLYGHFASIQAFARGNCAAVGGVLSFSVRPSSPATSLAVRIFSGILIAGCTWLYSPVSSDSRVHGELVLHGNSEGISVLPVPSILKFLYSSPSFSSSSGSNSNFDSDRLSV